MRGAGNEQNNSRPNRSVGGERDLCLLKLNTETKLRSLLISLYSACIWFLTPTLPVSLCARLPWPSPVYSGVSWQHAAPSVPGHVQANGGRGGDVHGGDPECIQPSAHRTPQIRPEGRYAGYAAHAHESHHPFRVLYATFTVSHTIMKFSFII